MLAIMKDPNLKNKIFIIFVALRNSQVILHSMVTVHESVQMKERH